MSHDRVRPFLGEGLRALLPMIFVGGAACYQPHIVDGLKCAPPPDKACPDGFFCNPGDGLCHSHPPGDAMPIDQSTEMRPDGGGVDMPSDPGVDRAEAMCVAQRPMCTSQAPAGMCDPYCQSGCGGCNQRCILNTGDMLTCSTPLPGDVAPGQACVVASSGTAMQTDACAPGAVCMREGCGMHCFAYCRGDADCPTSSCSRPASATMGNPGGFKVCEVPFVACNPLQPRMGCPSAAETCYLSPVAPDKTFCDCPNGDKREADACASNQECFPGLVCVGTSAVDQHCRTACAMADANPCAGAATCRSINGSKTYGYCL